VQRANCSYPAWLSYVTAISVSVSPPGLRLTWTILIYAEGGSTDEEVRWIAKERRGRFGSLLNTICDSPPSPAHSNRTSQLETLRVTSISEGGRRCRLDAAGLSPCAMESL